MGVFGAGRGRAGLLGSRWLRGGHWRWTGRAPMGLRVAGALVGVGATSWQSCPVPPVGVNGGDGDCPIRHRGASRPQRAGGCRAPRLASPREQEPRWCWVHLGSSPPAAPAWRPHKSPRLPFGERGDPFASLLAPWWCLRAGDSGAGWCGRPGGAQPGPAAALPPPQPAGAASSLPVPCQLRPRVTASPPAGHGLLGVALKSGDTGEPGGRQGRIRPYELPGWVLWLGVGSEGVLGIPRGAGQGRVGAAVAGGPRPLPAMRVPHVWSPRGAVPSAVRRSPPSSSTPLSSVFFFFIAGRCLLFIILPPHTPFSSCSLAVLVGSDMNNSLYRHLSCYLYLSREGKGIGTRAGRACVAPMGVSGTALRGSWGGAWRTPAGPRAAGQGATCVGTVRRGRSRVGRGCSLLPAIIWQSRRGGLMRVEGAMELRAGGGRDAPGGPVGAGDPAVSPWKRVGVRVHPPEVPPRAPAARSCRWG